MPKSNKIKKAITWIRKTLDITDLTTTPGQIGDEISPGLDVLGWDLYQGMTSSQKTGVAVTQVISDAVPADTARLVTAVSLEQDDRAAGPTFWLEYENFLTNSPIGLGRVVTLPVTAASIRASLIDRNFLLLPGDTLIGNQDPVGGVGVVTRLRIAFVDVPLGEYIKSL